MKSKKKQVTFKENYTRKAVKQQRLDGGGEN